MNKTIQVGLLFGGNSSEYEVSIMSVNNIYDAIDKNKFEVHPIWVTKEGYLADEKDSYKVLANPKYTIENSDKTANISNIAQLANLPEIDVFFPTFMEI